MHVRPATAADRPTVERLWLMFRHDMSEFAGVVPRPDGTFRSERVDAAFGDPHWAAYLIERDRAPLGFAFVRALDAPTRVLNSFFVVRAVRRSGVGLRAVQDVLARHPGSWDVAFQDANLPAVHFWRHVATTVAGPGWTEERRPPDTWISFAV
ncbi:GNAT family N-acetyltransferase [Herbidospora daliensis]|uniref:GNAT family N-acetyltransferase n=1 Tax=Herbidospora daliensis TaxID=295585 RepID=UPI001E5795EC|nr:GNAT family N-acetyltransferase [Herbidospora daliensis]